MLVRLGEESDALVSLVCTMAYESRPHESRLRIVLCLYNFPFRQANSAADVLSTNPGSELRMNAMTCADSNLRLHGPCRTPTQPAIRPLLKTIGLVALVTHVVNFLRPNV